MGIKIKWKAIGARSERWDYSRVLYAYLDPASDQIVYIGLAYHRTVRQRFNDRDKDALFKFLHKHGIREVEVLVGELIFEGRLTRQLLSDVESLLIKTLRPIGNIMCQQSRISRPGLTVECHHHWPHARTRFVDKK